MTATPCSEHCSEDHLRSKGVSLNSGTPSALKNASRICVQRIQSAMHVLMAIMLAFAAVKELW